MDTFIQEISLIPRAEGKQYNIQPNAGLLDILSLIYEFKMLNGKQLSRFLKRCEDNKYLYLRLRRMWLAGLLDCFKVFAGARYGMPVYYLLARPGLEMLKVNGRYGEQEIADYPDQKSLVVPSSFRHDVAVVELGSLEAKNNSEQLHISFKGETNAGRADDRSGKMIEVFTPDYIALYSFGDEDKTVYTEFERTPKSREMMTDKLDRYVHHLPFEERQQSIVRLVFNEPAMERSFWKMEMHNPGSLKVMTTNTSLLSGHEQFLEPIYLSSSNMSSRVKLIPFL